MRTPAARPCRSSGYDPPSACVASRLAPKGDSILAWLVDRQRTPFFGDVSRVYVADSDARRQPRSARTLFAVNILKIHVPPVDMRVLKAYPATKRNIGLAERKVLMLVYK
jgi:hypothetical protein